MLVDARVALFRPRGAPSCECRARHRLVEEGDRLHAHCRNSRHDECSNAAQPMTTHRQMSPHQGAALSAERFGFLTAIGTALSTILTFAIAILTPPLSGQLCKEGCFQYPYLEIAARFPRDYYWMFVAIPTTLLYLAWMVSLDARATLERRPFAQLAVALSVMAALTLVGDYFVQLAVISPSLRAGESDGVSILTQYNPHGAFIALEELGYLLMSLSFACMGFALPGATRMERALRWLLIGGF